MFGIASVGNRVIIYFQSTGVSRAHGFFINFNTLPTPPQKTSTVLPWSSVPVDSTPTCSGFSTVDVAALSVGTPGPYTGWWSSQYATGVLRSAVNCLRGTPVDVQASALRVDLKMRVNVWS